MGRVASPVCFLPCPVVFDLDGTLLDSLPDIAAAVNRLLATEGVLPMERAEVQSYVGDGAPKLIERVMAARGLDAARHQDLTLRMISDYSARAGEATTVYPGAVEALEILASRGHPLGLCTNKPGAATLGVLRHFGLDQVFGAVVAGDTLPERKPHPAPLRTVLRRLGSEPDAGTGAFVGDSAVDRDTARAAGVPFLLFDGGYWNGPAPTLPAAMRFTDFGRLPDMIAALAE